KYAGGAKRRRNASRRHACAGHHRISGRSGGLRRAPDRAVRALRPEHPRAPLLRRSPRTSFGVLPRSCPHRTNVLRWILRTARRPYVPRLVSPGIRSRAKGKRCREVSHLTGILILRRMLLSRILSGLPSVAPYKTSSIQEGAVQ